MPGSADVIFDWWFQSSHRPNLKWKLSVSSRLFSLANADFLIFNVRIKQRQRCLRLPPSGTSSVTPTCFWGLCCKWKGADCLKLLLKLLTNHHKLQRLLENHQSIVNHLRFSLAWSFGYRLRWRAWACLCISLVILQVQNSQVEKGETERTEIKAITVFTPRWWREEDDVPCCVYLHGLNWQMEKQ